VFARCDLDEVPEWLRGGSRNGSAASMSWVNLSHDQLMPGGWRRYNRGLVTDVSILSPSVRPVEGRARVELLERASTTSAAPTTRASTQPAGGEVIYCPPGAVIRRPIGQVLGVR
jgi:hypothetical protein